MFGQSAGQYYYGDCVTFEGDAPGVEQPQVDVHYGQSVVLNVKKRKLYVKLVNATDKEKEADVNLKRFSLKKLAKKTILTGAADDENNYEKQPISPKTETFKAEKKFDIDLPPYSMVMLEYSL
jgi:alpha-L-arabinofuranosidase